MKRVLITTALLILLPVYVSGEVIQVPGDEPTIQGGIDAADDGDTVLIADGTYAGADNKNLSWNGDEKHIAVMSENGPAACVIDCEEWGRGFAFYETHQTSDDVVEGFTIRNGCGELGGGIYCSLASPAIIECNVFDCIADQGGGVFCERSSAEIVNCAISNNLSGYHAGGIYCMDEVDVNISGCAISGNTGLFTGGGVCCWDGSITVSDCLIADNYT